MADYGYHHASLDSRVACVHRAEGLSAPNGRYTLIVLLLVSLTSVPTLAAVGAGAATLADDAIDETTPFVAPPPGDLVVIVPIPPPPLTDAYRTTLQARQRFAPASGWRQAAAAAEVGSGRFQSMIHTGPPAGSGRAAPPEPVQAPWTRKQPQHRPGPVSRRAVPPAAHSPNRRVPRRTPQWPAAVAGRPHQPQAPHATKAWHGFAARAQVVGPRG